MNHGIILAGGVGTRLWPVSRQNSPKQFQPLAGKRSLIQQAFDRLSMVVAAKNISVVTNAAFARLTHQQLPKVAVNQILSEPVGRNTAPAVGLGLLNILRHDPEAKIVSVHADHFVGQPKAFKRAIKAGFALLAQKPDGLVTVGVKPTSPDTGLGYIKMADQNAEIADQPIFGVEKFIEKPNQKTAETFVASWEYLWNTGYFLFNASVMAKHFATLLPETTKLLKEYLASRSSPIYERIASASFDTAIVEKLPDISVIPADLEWSDIGSWSALHKLIGGGSGQTVARGNFHGLNNQNCLVLGDKKLITAIGLQDVVIIDTADATLICHQDAVHQVKNLVEELKAMGKIEYL